MVDLIKKTITICVYAKLPFLPEVKLGCASGDIEHGVEIKFDTAIASGDFTFYVKNGWLRLKYDIKILKTNYSGDIALIPFKCVLFVLNLLPPSTHGLRQVLSQKWHSKHLS